MNWHWNWNCLNNDWRIGIGTGIVYTKAEKLVLVLELFTQCLKNWYCRVFCLALFFMGVGVLVLDNTWSYNNNNKDNNNVCIFIHQTLMTLPNWDLYCLTQRRFMNVDCALPLCTLTDFSYAKCTYYTITIILLP